MSASRLLTILTQLQLRERATAEDLAQELEVTVRTIYRDIDALCAAGIPVLSERGRGGGFHLAAAYRARFTGLSAAEAEALLMIGLPGPAESLGLAPAAEAARRKLLVALPQSQSGDAGRVGERFHLDPVEWYHEAPDLPHLPALARAVLDQRMVAVDYTSWRGARRHRLEPLGLVLKAGNWYVVARSSGKVRTFKVAEIRTQTVLATRFTRPARFDLAAYWAESLARFEATLRKEVARVRVSPAGRERLARLGAFAARAAREAGAPDRSGWCEVALPIEGLEHAALQLLGLGAEFEVVAPSALRARVHELARTIARRNAGESTG